MFTPTQVAAFSSAAKVANARRLFEDALYAEDGDFEGAMAAFARAANNLSADEHAALMGR